MESSVSPADDDRVAVYIDFDNILISRRNQAQEHQGMDPSIDLDAIIDFCSSFGIVATSRAYGDWSRTETWPYRQRLLSRAVDTIQMFTTSGKVKNAADIRLAIDVIEDLYLLHDITDVVIVAGDSDYIPLAQRVRRMGRKVIGIGVAGSISRLLAAACDEFYDYDELPGLYTDGGEDEETATEENDKAGCVDHDLRRSDHASMTGKSAETKHPATETTDSHVSRRNGPKPSPASDEAGKTSGTGAVSAARDAASRNATPKKAPDDNGNTALVSKSRATQLLLRALTYFMSKTEEEWHNASKVKNQILRMEPAFQESALGYSTFTKFVESRQGQVEIRRNGNITELRLRAGRR